MNLKKRPRGGTQREGPLIRSWREPAYVPTHNAARRKLRSSVQAG